MKFNPPTTGEASLQRNCGAVAYVNWPPDYSRVSPSSERNTIARKASL